MPRNTRYSVPLPQVYLLKHPTLRILIQTTSISCLKSTCRFFKVQLDILFSSLNLLPVLSKKKVLFVYVLCCKRPLIFLPFSNKGFPQFCLYKNRQWNMFSKNIFYYWKDRLSNHNHNHKLFISIKAEND